MTDVTGEPERPAVMSFREGLPLRDRGALRNRLLDVLAEAQQAKTEGRYEALDELLRWLRDQASEADGWPLALIEVTSHAVEALAGTSLPPEEMALRAFIEKATQESLHLLSRLARFELVSAAERPTNAGEDDALWGRLAVLGIIVPVQGGHAISRRCHELVRELVGPIALNSARGSPGLGGG